MNIFLSLQIQNPPYYSPEYDPKLLVRSHTVLQAVEMKQHLGTQRQMSRQGDGIWFVQ